MDILKRVEHLVKKTLKPEKPLPQTWSNFEYNKDYWYRYARAWNKIIKPIANAEIGVEQSDTYRTHLGDEWGRKADVDSIVEEYIYPFIGKESIVAEIGVGGGRIASRVAGYVKQLHCFDISSEMIN
jgi:hypothetical protein